MIRVELGLTESGAWCGRCRDCGERLSATPFYSEARRWFKDHENAHRGRAVGVLRRRWWR